MEERIPVLSCNDTIEILGQQPSLSIYTQISFCFPLNGISQRPKIIRTLEDGLDILSTNFPWTAGQVVNEGARSGNSGTFKIKALEERPLLVVKVLTQDDSAPTMQSLRSVSFPISMLDETSLRLAILYRARLESLRTTQRQSFSYRPLSLRVALYSLSTVNIKLWT